jgi:hypothetical protein
MIDFKVRVVLLNLTTMVNVTGSRNNRKLTTLERKSKKKL